MSGIASMFGARDNVEGIIDRIGVYQAKERLVCAFTLKDVEGEFTGACDSRALALTARGDAVAFKHHPKKDFKKFVNHTLEHGE